ncbi:hypothetical protein AARAC_010226 [Aspergillus arachidicola]|uniref:FAD-binding PCMH-type domain-containing protein n=1 Tax=Aspergillus arachidicola TaxID=656916 RepID=A0A2G7GAT1_9EURO|nr:hypothetical protein AARAC_010226 [Aspergillus arachidicola]
MLLGFNFVGLMSSTLLAFSSSVATSQTFTSANFTGFPPCDALIEASLSNRLLFATDPEYEPRIESYWAWNTRRHPYCIVQPHNVKEVSTAMTALLGSKAGAGDGTGAGAWYIAVRAGGHNLGYSNNIDTGVTIDLKYLNQTTYDSKTNIASVSPGSHWEDVYAELHKHGVVVTGGRDGDVGVGGFLLGGGSTYYMAQTGFGCDSIKNFEVVLTNGTIVNANEDENSDLWRALKGGGSNFGIVTRYDMEALEDKYIAHGQRAMLGNYSTELVDAVVDFTNNQKKYDKDALVAILNSTAFSKLRQIPQVSPFAQDVVPLSVAAANSTLPSNAWTLQTTLTFKNDKRIMNHAAKVHKQFAQKLTQGIGENNFYSIVFFQPLPSFYAEISEEKGGNMFADTLKDHNAILWTAGVFVYTNQSDFAVAQLWMNEMVAELKSFSASVGGENPLIYLNYADFSQNPLGSYPKENVDHMRKVAAKYDPKGEFQTRFPGGFKISRVEA